MRSPGFYESDLFCCACGQINDSAFDKRTPVVDAHYDILAVSQIGYSYQSSEWKGGMGGGQLAHIECFAVCCLATVKLIRVKGGAAFGNTDVCLFLPLRYLS